MTTELETAYLELNEKWKTFIEEQRLYILVNATEEVVDFLHNLVFTKPNVLKKKFILTPWSIKPEVSLKGWEIHAQYNGTLHFDKTPFLLGLYEKFVDDNYDFSQWEVNGGWSQDPDFTLGESFTHFFEKGHLDKQAEETIEEMLNMFKMHGKISSLYPLYTKELQTIQNQKTIEKYSDSTVKLIEENEKLFVVFHDGHKIPFTEAVKEEEQ